MSYPTRPFRIPNSLKLGPQTQLKRPLIKRKKGENGPFRATFYLKTIELNCFLLPTEAQQKLCILDQSTRQIFKRSKKQNTFYHYFESEIKNSHFSKQTKFWKQCLWLRIWKVSKKLPKIPIFAYFQTSVS